MNYEPVVKPPPERMPVTPKLIGYEAAGDAFRWDDIRAELDGLPGGGLNIAYALCRKNPAHNPEVPQGLC